MEGMTLHRATAPATPLVMAPMCRRGCQNLLRPRRLSVGDPRQRLRLRATRGEASDEGLPKKPPDIIVELNVGKEDTLQSLAEMYQIPLEKMLAANEGKEQLEEGQKLRFSMPLPYTREAMRELLSPTKEMVTDAVKERIRAERAAGKQEIYLAEPVRTPAQDSTTLATAKYLGSMGAKVALFGGVLVAFLTLSRRSKEQADRRAMELFTEHELSRPAASPSPAPQNGESVPQNGEAAPAQSWRERRWQANRGGEASTSSPGPFEGRATAIEGPLQDDIQSSSARSGTALEEDPAWLALPNVHYALMQGNQQPCFRLATGQHDTRHWLAWEDPEDLRRMLKCMTTNGFLSKEMAVKILPSEPYPYLQTAELNQRSLGFIPAGTQFEEDWHDEKLMEVLTRACQVIPRHPADATSSAPSILKRWRRRVGVTVSSEAVEQSAAWEVRSSADEEELSSAGKVGRLIETTASAPDTSEEGTEEEQGTVQQGHEKNADVAANTMGAQAAHGSKSMWQRLRGIGRQQRERNPKNSTDLQDTAEGELNAGRIMERSRRSMKSTQDFSEHLFGCSTGSAIEVVQRGSTPGEAPSDVSQSHSSAPKQQSQPDRQKQYAQLVTGQQHKEAQSILSQLRSEDAPTDVEHEMHDVKGNGSSSSGDVSRLTEEQKHQMKDYLAAEAAKLEAQARQGQSQEWWKQLKVIHVPARDYTDGAFGFLTTQALEYDGAEGGGLAQSIVAFESRGDAQEVEWLWDSWPEAGAGSNRTMPMRPDQLAGIAERETYGVTVFRRKQLPVRPGLSERDLGAMLQAYSKGA